MDKVLDNGVFDCENFQEKQKERDLHRKRRKFVEKEKQKRSNKEKNKLSKNNKKKFKHYYYENNE